MSLETASQPILLTEAEAAKILGFSARTLQGWRCRGGGPRFVRVSQTCIRYRREDLESWIQERVRTSTSDTGVSSLRPPITGHDLLAGWNPRA